MESATHRLAAQIATLTCVSLLSAAALADAHTVGDQEDWLPLKCKAERTVGLHDLDDGDEVPVEQYEARIFLPSEFSIEENKTFTQLLDDPDIALYLSLKSVDATQKHEYSCKRVKGHGSRAGFSCTNMPPTDVLTIDPETKRFSRASTGAWTLYTSEDTGVGASVFVEIGKCFATSEASEDSPAESQENTAELP